MRKLLFIAFFVLLAFPSVAGAHGQRLGWPSPDTQCNAANLGRVEWVHDPQLDVWVKWRCIRDDTGRYHWVRIDIRHYPPWQVWAQVNGWRYVQYNGAKLLRFHHADNCRVWHYYPAWDGYVRRVNG